MVDSKVKMIVEQDKMYTEFKGALSEQFIGQELHTA
jgi:hypothetical protein